MNENKGKLTKRENIIVGSTSALGTIFIYTAGINILKENSCSLAPLLGLTGVSFIAPHVISTTTTYLIKKINKKGK